MNADAKGDMMVPDVESAGFLTSFRERYRERQVRGATRFIMKQIDRGNNFIPVYPSLLRSVTSFTVTNQVVLEMIEVALSEHGIDAEIYRPNDAPRPFYEIHIHSNKATETQPDVTSLELVRPAAIVTAEHTNNHGPDCPGRGIYGR